MKWKFNRIWTIIFTIFISAAVFGSTAFAEDKSAKQLAKDAGRAYSAGKYDEALIKFTEAYKKDPNPALLYNMGRVCESQADFKTAVMYYVQFVTSPDVDQDARADAMERIKTLNDVMEIQKDAAHMPSLNNAPAPSAPRKKSTKKAAAAVPAGSCIDINTAEAAELDQLKGIGLSTAEKIVAYRKANGPFRSIDALDQVPSIGASKIAGMRHQICPIGGAVPAKAAAPAAAVPAAPAKAPAKAAAPKSPAKAPAKAPVLPSSDAAILEI